MSLWCSWLVMVGYVISSLLCVCIMSYVVMSVYLVDVCCYVCLLLWYVISYLCYVICICSLLLCLSILLMYAMSYVSCWCCCSLVLCISLIYVYVCLCIMSYVVMSVYLVDVALLYAWYRYMLFHSYPRVCVRDLVPWMVTIMQGCLMLCRLSCHYMTCPVVHGSCILPCCSTVSMLCCPGYICSLVALYMYMHTCLAGTTVHVSLTIVTQSLL